VKNTFYAPWIVRSHRSYTTSSLPYPLPVLCISHRRQHLHGSRPPIATLPINHSLPCFASIFSHHRSHCRRHMPPLKLVFSIDFISLDVIFFYQTIKKEKNKGIVSVILVVCIFKLNHVVAVESIVLSFFFQLKQHPRLTDSKPVIVSGRRCD
jgi:hypothetical protein